MGCSTGAVLADLVNCSFDAGGVGIGPDPERSSKNRRVTAQLPRTDRTASPVKPDKSGETFDALSHRFQTPLEDPISHAQHRTHTPQLMLVCRDRSAEKPSAAGQLSTYSSAESWTDTIAAVLKVCVIKPMLAGYQTRTGTPRSAMYRLVSAIV